MVDRGQATVVALESGPEPAGVGLLRDRDHHGAGTRQQPTRAAKGRATIRPALQLCHIVTIKGREYGQCLPASAA